MKFQPRRFVVEVKRGTSRSAFSSPDTVSEKFGSAEELLFGAPRKPVPKEPAVTAEPSGRPSGRIWESLDAPAPAPVDDLPAPRRRGRKPGSKNKPKPAPLNGVASDVAAVRFGADPEVRGRRFAVAERAAPESSAQAAAEVETTPSATTVPTPREGRRPRLRERSRILKRYVLGTEPRPGQVGYLRARRAARRG